MTVKGLDRLERRLKAIPESVRVAVRASMAATADEIVARMKDKVVEDTGTLERSIGWSWGRAPKSSQTLVGLRADSLRAADSIVIYAGGAATSRPVRKSEKGNAPTYDYALAIEFGTSSVKAQPFFYVTWRQSRGRIRARNRASLRKVIRES